MTQQHLDFTPDHDGWQCPECGIVGTADDFEVIEDWGDDGNVYVPGGDVILCLNCNVQVGVEETEVGSG